MKSCFLLMESYNKGLHYCYCYYYYYYYHVGLDGSKGHPVELLRLEGHFVGLGRSKGHLFGLGRS